MPTNAFGQEIGAPQPDFSPPPWPPRTPMAGESCSLQPLAGSHADGLFAAFAEAPDGRDWTYMFTERIDDEAAWGAHIAREAASQDPLHYAILDASGTPLGKAAFMRIDPANGVIEIGHIALSPRLQRTRAATEAIALMMRRAFDELGYRRLEWKCDSLNIRSRRAAERFGFVFEGIFRQAIVTKGRNRDTAWYAMIDTDWPRARAAFDAWLAPDNFTDEGAQRRRLEAFRQQKHLC